MGEERGIKNGGQARLQLQRLVDFRAWMQMSPAARQNT